MIAPRRHVAQLTDLRDAKLTDLFKLLGRVQQCLERALRPEGFNIGINCGRVAGAGIEDHLHIHIVPRWCGDTNFMPVFSNTKIIPQSLDALYALLTNVTTRRTRTSRT